MKSPPHDLERESRASANEPMSRPHPTAVRLYSSCDLPTENGVFEVHVYRDSRDEEHLLLIQGDPANHESPFVRIHSECFTGEVLGSLKCDCHQQLDRAMAQIAAEGCGVIVYLRQEGRGIGLGDKIRAYAEQAAGADTVEANELLGLPIDARDFSVAAAMLKAEGLEQIRLNTNNPRKVLSLRDNDITITEIIPSPAKATPHNRAYLRTKQDRLGHHGLIP